MNQTTVIQQSRAVLSHHARSFRWAAIFLPTDSHDDAAVVYAFCRAMDDAADEAPNDTVARQQLDAMHQQLLGQRPAKAEVAAYLHVAQTRAIPAHAALELHEGIRSDLDTVRIADDDELLQYCYRVAGVVGLMMCGVLRVRDPQAATHAVDLGRAMQLTNICRDVLEDAQRGRVYLPATRLQAAGTSQEALLQGEADPKAVANVVRPLLDLAESYYRSADEGMRFIPWRARFAIVIASRLYRAIGLRLLRQHQGNALHGRTVVPWWEKVGWLFVGIVHWIRVS